MSVLSHLTVLIDAKAVSGAVGGIGRYTQRLIEALTSLGSAVRIVCLAPDSGSLRPNLGACPEIRIVSCDTESPSDQTRLPHIVREVGANVFHGPSFYLPPSLPVPGVVTVHDLAFLHEPDWYPPGFAAHLNRTTKESAERAMAIIAVSDTVRDELTRCFPTARGKTVRIYEAPAALEACPGSSPLPFHLEEGRYLLAVGVQQRRKNAVGLVRAFARLKSKRPVSEKLVLVGGSECEDPSLFTVINEAGLASAVLLTGRLPERTLDAMYRSARLFVHPSIEEGFGLPPLEAMARAVPTIATDGGSLPEILREGACIVSAGSDEALARAMDRLLCDDLERRQVAQRGLARAATFAWEKAARETLEVYRKVANPGSTAVGEVGIPELPAEVRSPVRIGVDARFFNLIRTGTGRYTREILPRLLRSSKNADFLVVGPDSLSGGFPEETASLVQHVAAGADTLLNPAWEQFSLPSVLPGCDLFLSLTGALPVARSCKGVAVIHGLSFSDRPEDFPPDLGQYLARWVGATCRSADLLIAVSRFTERSIERVYGISENRIRTIYHGRPTEGPLSPKELKTKSAVERPYLLFVGSLEPNKAVPNLIEAFSRIMDRWPGELVLAVRQGRDFDLVKRMIGRPAFSSRVRLVLEPSDDDLGPLYQHAALYVTSSLYESFGLPLVEAMGFGLPVVAFAVTAMEEIIGEGGGLVRESTPEALATALFDILRNPERMETLRELARNRVQEFSWDKAAQETWKALVECLEIA